MVIGYHRNDTLLFLSIHENLEWTVKADVAHETSLLYCLHAIKQILAEDV